MTMVHATDSAQRANSLQATWQGCACRPAVERALPAALILEITRCARAVRVPQCRRSKG